jgi:hypothetical protein
MRPVVFMAAIMIGAGCCMHPKQPPPSPQPVLTAGDAYFIATIYLVGHYGACGSRTTNVNDCGDYWSAQTVTGLASSPGPELHIDKKTRRVTAVLATSK